MTVITRFAPSPTGKLHIGNARTALINYLYSQNLGGEFYLRIDDTDKARSKAEYTDAIINDLKWLGFKWDKQFHQSDRLEKYDEAKNKLLTSGRLYPCYESKDELEVKRKLLLAANKPPIYDRAALKLTAEQIAEYEKQGRKPHYRFLVKDENISWHDLVRGDMSYEGANISDPILIRGDGSMTYMICSTVDDVEYGITHILRGEDHLTNSALQKQLFEALGAKAPECGHLSLIKAKDSKISKRLGGFEIENLRNELSIEAEAIISFLSTIGTSRPTDISGDIEEIINEFDINLFSKSPTTYMPEELIRLNHKLLISMDYQQAKPRLDEIGASKIGEDFWLAIRPNLQNIKEAKDWWHICHEEIKAENEDLEYLQLAASLLPQELDKNSWSEWTNKLSEKTERKGKNLFLPLRIALTGMKSGPEMSELLPLINRDKILSRLQ